MKKVFPYHKSSLSIILLLAVGFLACNNSDNQEEPSPWEKFTRIFDNSLDSNTTNIEADSLGLEFGLGDYDDLFAQINGIDISFYDSILNATGGKVVWDSIQMLQSIIYNSDSSYLNPKYKVFGWHPFWMGSAFENYNFDLLSHISWFSYDVDPGTGSYGNPAVIEQLKNAGKDLITMAQEKDCKVLLTITNHGRDKTKQFLSNTSAQQLVLIDSVLQLVQSLNLNGVDVNFENIHKSFGKEMTTFIKRFSNRLKALHPDYIFSLTIPKINDGQIDNIKSLNEYVDIFVLTGYDFHTEGSPNDGPVAPLFASDGDTSINYIVQRYLDDGLDASKLLLGLPYYGAVWTSGDPEIKSTDRKFQSKLTYRAIIAKYSRLGPPSIDNESKSAYYLNRLDSDTYEKIWFDDSLTLQIKFDWAKQRGLGGVGVWAMGYDNGRTELWHTIDKSFGITDTISLSISGNKGFDVAIWLGTYNVPIFITVLFWTVFVSLGFFISLFDWNVRNYLFSNKSSRLIMILSIFGLVTFLYLAYFFKDTINSIESSTGITFTIGMVSGGIITGIIVYLYRRHRSRLP